MVEIPKWKKNPIMNQLEKSTTPVNKVRCNEMKGSGRKDSKNLFSVFLLVLIGLGISVWAQPASGALDQKGIHNTYNNGEFESVISAIEAFTKANPVYQHADSVFIAKHLAVVYSAAPGTREKGKYYMYRLLDLEPAIKLIDMYVSDEIDRLFDKVKEEYYARNGVRPSTVQTSTAKIPPAEIAQSPYLSTTKILVWTAVGTAVIGTGIATYFLMQPKSSSQIYTIDARSTVGVTP